MQQPEQWYAGLHLFALDDRYVILLSGSGQARPSKVPAGPQKAWVLSIVQEFIMTAFRIVSAAALTFAALAAFAQQSGPAPAAQGMSAMTSAECAAAKKARHDHGIERGYGPMAIKGCAPMTATKVSASAITGHDHGKFHKNQ